MYNSMHCLDDLIADIKSTYVNVNILIGGDLNARTGKLDDIHPKTNIDMFLDLDNDDEIFEDIPMIRKNRDPSIVNNYGRQLTRLCKDYGIFILNGRCKGDEEGNITCIANKGKTVVDYFITNPGVYRMVSSMQVHPRSESDHFPISIEFMVSDDNTMQDNVNQNDVELLVQKYVWKDECKDVYFKNLKDILNKKFDHFNDILANNIDKALDLLINCVKKAGDCMQQSTKVIRQNPQPKWWNESCREAKREKYFHLEMFHLSNSNSDLDNYLKARKKFKYVCAESKRQKDKGQLMQLKKSIQDKGSKSFWHNLKCMINDKSGNYISAIRNYTWYHYFKTLLNPKIELSNPVFDVLVNDTLESITYENDEELYNEPITRIEIQHCISKMRKGKSPGPDGIPVEFFSLSDSKLIEYLFNVFNRIFEQGTYPAEWSKSLIFPLHKKGNMTDVSNYRGISLLNIISKIFSSILHIRLSAWAEYNNIIPESQSGFRKTYSTIDNIFCLQSITQKYLSKRLGRFYVLFVDFAKAFDSIDRSKLFFILYKRGLKGKMLRILIAMYDDVFSAVKVSHGSSTNYFRCTSGVRQGCILSPLLFNLYLAEFVDELCECDAIHDIELLSNDLGTSSFQYADDLCLVSDTVGDMQKKIDTLANYCVKWGLQVNIDKTKMVVFRNGGILKQNELWYYKGKQIEITPYYSYLGLLFSCRLNWSKCVETLCSKARRIFPKIRYICRRYQNLDIKTLFTLFDMKIKPLLLYGCEIWGVKRFEDIEHVHIKYCKLVLNVGKTTINNVILRDTGRHHMFVDSSLRAIKYWLKLLKMQVFRYPKKCYLQSLKLDELGRSNWATEIRKLLCRLGFTDAWRAQAVGNEKEFIMEFKTRLCSMSWEELEVPEEINRYIPAIFYPAPYIHLISSYSKRRIITLIRGKGLPININMKRFDPKQSDICRQCDLNCIEDELHVIFICVKYKTFRSKYIKNKYLKGSDSKALYDILFSNDFKELNDLATFVQIALKGRIEDSMVYA